ncbi:hypothetical protein SAMN05428944_0228 [Streptomyces sp. 1222.5]|nr:hypothetical protein BX260_7864 [Streptomyces sp. 5112.2]SEB55390.1 hypothetical protein SAMN05428944_0228 [Streptomyces sp. 1222.5]
MHLSTDSTVLAYKGVGDPPLWLLITIVVIALVALVRSRRGR